MEVFIVLKMHYSPGMDDNIHGTLPIWEAHLKQDVQRFY